MIPLLWHSNAPHAGTGYAQQTALFAPRLKEDFSLGISAFYGVEGSPISYQEIPVYPALGHSYGNEAIQEHATVHFNGDLRAGLVMTLMDVWILDPTIWRQLNLACWVPVDHQPCPPPVAQFLHAAEAVPIAMSRFGQDQLYEAGLDPLYVPHGIDTSVYEPLPKRESRESCGLPEDGFIVGMIAANKGNPSRKCFAEAIEAFKELRLKHGDAVLYLHTELSGRFDGVNLPDLIDLLGVPRDAVVFCDQYRAVHYPFTQKRMAQLYSSLDVLLMPSAGEGFGIPAIEAQACGVPVIGSDFSAQPELIGAGWLVEGQRHYTALKSWQFTPRIADIAEALHEAYGLSPDQRKRWGEKAREKALEYDAEVVYPMLRDALNEAWSRIEERQPMEVVA